MQDLHLQTQIFSQAHHPTKAREINGTETPHTLKLIKIGARVVRHARAITLQLAEVAVTGSMVRAVLTAIRRLRAPPSCV